MPCESGGSLCSKQVRTCSALGEAKIVPHTQAVSKPWPTKAENPGSWPDPPPQISETFPVEDSEDG